MEIRCEPLDMDRLAAEVGETVRVIQEQAQGELCVMYGWAYDVENQWEWIPLPANGLSAFLDDSARKGVYRHGHGDLLIKVPSLSVEVTFCHESDIHVAGEANDLMAHIRLRWLRQGIRVWLRKKDGEPWEEAMFADQ